MIAFRPPQPQRRSILKLLGFGALAIVTLRTRTALAGGKGKVRIVAFDPSGVRTGVVELDRIEKPVAEWKKQLTPQQFEIARNGQNVGEIGLESCYAGHWDVSLIFVTGDEASCYEARQQFPGVVTAAVKRGGEDPEFCAGLDPEVAHREIARKAAEAVEKARSGELRPF